MAKSTTCCPKDCPRRAVGCRSDCPDWQDHERKKAERYAAHQQRIASYPPHARREHNTRRELRSQLK